MDVELITVASDAGVMNARQKGRELAMTVGISGSDLTLMATAISEIARNIVQYAGQGEIEFRSVVRAGKRGLLIIARDNGPGIPDIARAMQDGYSTSRGMGLGLPGAKRLMDDFKIVSEVGKGTTVSMVKWEHS
jgi:serine/threonine-protein kinase RsbT